MTALVVAVLSLCSGTARAGVTLPTPIEKGICYESEIHGRITGHLLFSYFVTSTGRVREPRLIYARVQPPELGGKIAGALRQCMEGWKFKPGTRDGQPAGFGMMTPFHFFQPAPPDDPEVPLPAGGTIGKSRIDEIRRAKLELIDHLLSIPQGREIRGAGWILITDLGTKDVNVVTQALEQAGRAFDTVFPSAPPAPESDSVTIVAFRDGLSQAQVDSFDNLRPVKYGAAGKYSAEERIIYAAKGSRPTPTLSELFVHEAAHHLTQRRLFQGKEPPVWVNEGIASFLECLKEGRGGTIDLGGFERARQAGGFSLWERPAVGYLGELRQAVKKDSMLPLAVLLGRSSFNGDDGPLLYATSWLFVHYLINAEGGRWRAPFQVWLAKFAVEEKEPDLAAALGVPVLQVYSALPTYLQGLE